MASLNPRPACATQSMQRGRTLIELLVAIGLGLLILLGVGSLFLGSNQSSRVATNVASAEETGQVILSIIGESVRRAGYSEIVGVSEKPSRADLLYSGPSIQACVDSQFALTGAGEPILDAITGNYTCGAASPGRDSLAVVFQADSVIASPQNATADCLGQAARLETIVNTNYRVRVTGEQIPLVRNIYTVPAGTNNLTCRGIGNPGGAATLIGEVEEFKVYFGYDDAAQATPLLNTGRPAARTLRDAAYISARPVLGPNFPAWDFVVTAHVCVLIRSVEVGITAQTGAVTYRRCPQTADQAAGSDATPDGTSTDGRVRRAYSQVFTVRSRAAPAPAI